MTLAGKLVPKQVSSNDQDVGLWPLSKDQVDHYWRNGYLLIKKLYDVTTLNLFRKRFKEICNDKEIAQSYSIVKDPELFKRNANPEMYINKVQELLYDDVFMRYSEDPKCLRILGQLIGDKLTAINCMLINKPPGTHDHPPHQDLYYLPIRPADKIVGVWTAVDHVYLDNGCLFVVPGSHKIEALYHHVDQAKEKKQFYVGIAHSKAAPADQRVHLQMESGDTLFFHPYLVHGSRANISKEFRKAMTVHYAASDCHYIDVTGTVQEPLATAVQHELEKRGAALDFIDLWKIKSKPIKGIRSHL